MELTMVMARTYLKAGKTRKSVALDSFRKSPGYCRRNATRIVHRLGLNVPVIAIHTVDYPAPARRPVYSVLANRKFELEQLNGMRPWEDALDDCLLRYQEVLSHG